MLYLFSAPYCNKLPQMKWLKKTLTYFIEIPAQGGSADSLLSLHKNQGICRAEFHLEVLGMNPLPSSLKLLADLQADCP